LDARACAAAVSASVATTSGEKGDEDEDDDTDCEEDELREDCEISIHLIAALFISTEASKPPRERRRRR